MVVVERPRQSRFDSRMYRETLISLHTFETLISLHTFSMIDNSKPVLYRPLLGSYVTAGDVVGLLTVAR